LTISRLNKKGTQDENTYSLVPPHILPRDFLRLYGKGVRKDLLVVLAPHFHIISKQLQRFQARRNKNRKL